MRLFNQSFSEQCRMRASKFTNWQPVRQSDVQRLSKDHNFKRLELRRISIFHLCRCNDSCLLFVYVARLNRAQNQTNSFEAPFLHHPIESFSTSLSPFLRPSGDLHLIRIPPGPAYTIAFQDPNVPLLGPSVTQIFSHAPSHAAPPTVLDHPAQAHLSHREALRLFRFETQIQPQGNLPSASNYLSPAATYKARPRDHHP